ncbi:hypothetical protein SAMN04490248_11449 [Salinihabitans flavidus]|uniref:DUF2125 domain-containing protein n=1 Tax=Salinihabitans flavidus TaxID=569882 RepID=A0A1H8T4Y5_9RHOB|nr:DUF2125 domain-containing protein [Salinihabitans flavidus]SEO86017.1 hypothetical protein SAMN04490248_11449 [Salinihabitans flavidus]
MFPSNHIVPATAVSLILSGGGALADVTPQDVWQSWQGYLGSSGYEVSGNESRSGDTLTVTGLTMSGDIPDEDGTVTVSLSEIAFRDNGDGTVQIIMPASSPLVINLRPEDEEAVDITLDLTYDTLAMTASGAPRDISYAYSADSMGATLTEIVVDGEVVEAAGFDASLDNVQGNSSMATTDLRRVRQSISAETLTYMFSGQDLENPERDRASFNGEMRDLSLDFRGDLPLDMDSEDPEEFFNAGFDIEGRFEQGGGSMAFSGMESGKPISGNFSSESGFFEVAMNKERMRYDGGTSGVTIDMAGAELPIPISAGIGELAYGLLLPLAKSEDLQDFGLKLRLADLSVDDALWGMFDPGQMLPRDPATLSLDITGTARLLMNMMSEEAQEMDEMPGELHSASLNDLRLNVAGAELTGTGDFTFDNSDTETFDGLPRPEGALDLRLTGANQLLDTLVEMGMLPKEQASGARMMMGMFAVPAGDDKLTSTIEINEEGQVLANGQRLR